MHDCYSLERDNYLLDMLSKYPKLVSPIKAYGTAPQCVLDAVTVIYEVFSCRSRGALVLIN